MQDEMQRSMSELRMKGEPAPYHIEYEIDDLASMCTAGSRCGGCWPQLQRLLAEFTVVGGRTVYSRKGKLA